MHASRFLRRNAVGLVAIFIALSGSAVALTRGEVRSRHIAPNAVKSKHIRDRHVRARDIAGRAVRTVKLADGAVTTAKVGAGAIGPAETGIRPMARVRRSTNQTIGHNLFTLVVFDVEELDTADIFAAPTDSLTIPIDGVYAISGNVCWAHNPVGHRIVRLQRGAAAGFDHAGVEADAQQNTSAEGSCQGVSTITTLSAGELLQLEVLQSSGGSLNVIANGQYSPVLAVAWLSPAG